MKTILVTLLTTLVDLLRSRASLHHTILPRFIPTSGGIFARIPGQRLPLRAGHTLAVVACGLESRGAVAAALLNAHLVLGGVEGFAVVSGFVGAGGEGIADAGDGGLGCCCHDVQE